MEGQPLVYNETVNYTMKRRIIRKAEKILTKKVTAYSFETRNSSFILNLISRLTAKHTEFALRDPIEKGVEDKVNVDFTTHTNICLCTTQSSLTLKLVAHTYSKDEQPE
jgi:hypothetical protein